MNDINQPKDYDYNSFQLSYGSDNLINPFLDRVHYYN